MDPDSNKLLKINIQNTFRNLNTNRVLANIKELFLFFKHDNIVAVIFRVILEVHAYTVPEDMI